MRRLAGIAVALALGACATGDDVYWPEAGLAPADAGAFVGCLRLTQSTVVSAHRGGYGPGLAENAIGTFEASVTRAPVMLETDVRITADGVLVLMHDETVDRTTTGTGTVSAMSAADFTALALTDNAGTPTGETAPTLASALAWAQGRAILQLDIKRGVPFPAVVEAVRRAGAQNRVIVIVYSIEDAALVHRLDPTLMLSVSIDEEADVAGLRAAGVDLSRVIAFTGTRQPNPALYDALWAEGIEVIFGTLGGVGSFDERFSAPGQEVGYVDLQRMGVQIIASDRAFTAFAALDAADGEGWGPGACLENAL
jgi:glycerophosphoryl diester phosphodiesterase